MNKTKPLQKKIHVVRLASNGNVGGVESRFLTLANGYDHEQFSLTVVYLCKGGVSADNLRAAGVNVIELDCKMNEIGRTRTGFILPLLQKLVTLQPDVIHSSSGTANFTAVLAGAIGKIAGTLSPKLYMITEEVCIPSRSLKARMRFAVSHALSDKIVAVSEAVREYLELEEWASATKIRVIHNCYSQRFELETAQGISGKKAIFRILMVSRLEPEKNIATVLHAIARLPANRRNAVSLAVVGDGSLRHALTRLAKELNISAMTDFTGFRSDIPELLSRADLYLLPSLSEAFGISLVEAMRMKVPVLASNVGGLAEVMRDYPPNHLLTPKDVDAWTNAILNVISYDTDYLNALVAHNYESVTARFSPQRYVRDLENLYRAGSVRTKTSS